MKKVALLLGLGLTLLTVACEKTGVDPTEPQPGQTDQPTGHVTPVGTPDGSAVSAQIGPEGGTLQSPDGRLQVIVPAGALSTGQTFQAQPITNQAPGGKGQAFRLTPHGQQFAKPVTVRFRYTEKDLAGTFADALGVAYQSDKGTWKIAGAVTHDAAAKTISVQTTHFSDWSFFEAISLEPAYRVLDPGQNAPLAVRCVVPKKDGSDLLVPIGDEAQDAELINPEFLLDSKFIDKWELKGDGDLQATGSTAKYFAPNRIPANNPVRVEVGIKSKGKAVGLLIARIYVAPEGISLQLDGGAWETYPGGANLTGTKNVITGRKGNWGLILAWTGKTEGQYAWTMGTDVSFVLDDGMGFRHYQNRYGLGPDLSGGFLTIDDDGSETGGYVVGTFNLEPAGWYQTDPYNPVGTARIRGFFRVKSVN
jgi:hypothetical protein